MKKPRRPAALPIRAAARSGLQAIGGKRRAVHGALALVFQAALAVAAQAQAADPMLLYDENGTTVRGHLQFGMNAVAERNLFWNLSNTFAPASGFDPDANWLESFVKAGLSFERSLDGGPVLYGKASAIASYTLGTDAYDFRNTGRVTLEEAYLGLRMQGDGRTGFDISAGPRELKLGTGMLIANGGSSGFERGALKTGPRKAWEMAAIGRIFSDGLTGTAFYIDPNERPANDGRNALAGLDLRFDAEEGGFLGITYLNVLKSLSPYIQAAPGGTGAPAVLPGAREGTQALNFYARTSPFSGALENWTFATDFAYQWNDRIDLNAWAGRVQVGYAFPGLPWSPSLTYSYQAFSGDNPNTPALERFDPLYYEGSPSAWATGSKSSMVFINSNVQAHGLALRMQPTARDTITLRYAHIRAMRLNSPLQFGQATRVDTTGGTANVIAGVTHPHLADDLFLEYSRIINPNTFLTAGLSVSFPGKGIRNVVGGRAPNWTGGFLNVFVNF
ncbi:alginate export family protein [Zhengella sp. ZM62]|uniref:alginate export family protein n=1 Tax=Zhengella sedimenti TaxID=3390035 RepID=UPI00397476BE